MSYFHGPPCVCPIAAGATTSWAHSLQGPIAGSVAKWGLGVGLPVLPVAATLLPPHCSNRSRYHCCHSLRRIATPGTIWQAAAMPFCTARW